jgi:membrane protein YdbS with pleckstrin-like domain
MPYPDHLLSRGETIVLHKHPHWKVLALPVVWLLLIVGAASFGIAFLDSRVSDPGLWTIVVIIVALLLIVFLVVVPFVKWRTEHFVLTDRHVFFRAGFFKRREHQIPLGRIQNLEVNVSFWGRILGYGTLTVESAADQPLSFYNVASLPRVQGQLNQLIEDDRTAGHPIGGMGERYQPGYGPGPGYDQGGAPQYGPDDRYYPPDDTSTRRIPQMRDQQGPGYDG